MVERFAERVDLPRSTHDGSAPCRAEIGGPRAGDLRICEGHLIADLIQAGVRFVHSSRRPSRRGLLEFFGNQVLVNAVAWTAGLMAAGVVTRFFEVRGIRNLWGLSIWSGRTVVNADDYRMITGLMAYSAGLVMLILARHLVLRLIAEFHQVRLERIRGPRAIDSGTGGAAIRRRATIDGPELDLDD